MRTPGETSTPAPTGARRLIQLDLLRGIAVVMVLLNHAPQAASLRPGPLALLVAPFSTGLWTGVDLFFVLSGYLIGGLLIAELRKAGRIDLKRFWIRRGFKIWPSYYLYLAALAVLTPIFYVDRSIPGSWLQGMLVNSVKLVYLQNYFPASREPYTQLLGNHTWTLAVEEHFYFLLPIVLVAASRRWRVVLPAVAFLLLAGCLALRLADRGRPMDWVWDYEVTHKRIDSLFFGVFLSYLWLERPGIIPIIRRARAPLALAGLALISPMFVLPLGHPFVKTAGYTLLALGYGCLLLVFLTTEPGRGWSGGAMASRPARWLAWVGFWSYSIYLWHFDVAQMVFRGYLATSRPAPSWLPTQDLWMVAYLAASIGLGSAIGHLVELPMLRLRDRLYPSRAAAVPARPAAEPAVAEVAG